MGKNNISKLMKKAIAVGCASVLMLMSIACKKDDIKSNEIDICSDEIREYLNAGTTEEQFFALSNAMGAILDKQYASFEYTSESGKIYRLFFQNANDKNDAFVLKGLGGTASGGLFTPGETYSYKVVAKDYTDTDFSDVTKWDDSFESLVTESGKVKIKDAPVRYITMDRGYNYRDLGGWKTESGKKINYGKIYRGARTNDFSEKDIAVLRDFLHIKSEIDLRNAHDDGGQNSSILGDNANYLKAPISQYSYILPSFSLNGRTFDTNSPTEIKRIFDFLANENNYPLFFHCNAGADRTGTLAFLICGSLGVSLDDLTRDFELTSFSKGGVRLRGKMQQPFEYGIMQDDSSNFVAWGDMVSRIKTDYPSPDGKLSSSIKTYLKSVCNISDVTLNKIADILLG